MRAVAIKKSGREKTTGFQEMGTLRCDGCGEEFFIGLKRRAPIPQRGGRKPREGHPFAKLKELKFA